MALSGMPEPMDIRAYVRKRPGMYVGGTDGRAANHMVLELVANALDQHLLGHADRIEVTVRGHSVTVHDDGAGMPLEDASAFITAHATANRHGHAPHVHAVRHGVGLAVVTALCRSLTVTADTGNTRWTQSFTKGVPTSKPQTAASGGTSGTTITMHIDDSLIAPCDTDLLFSQIAAQAALYPGLCLNVNGTDHIRPNGLSDWASEICSATCPSVPAETCWHRQDHPEFRMDVALAGLGQKHHVTRGWCNGVETSEGGSHIDALNHALAASKWQTAAVSLIHVIMKDPKFAGPTKEKLDRPDLVETIRASVLSALPDR